MRKRGELRPDGSRPPIIKRRHQRHHANSLHQYDETRAPCMYVDERDGAVCFDPCGDWDIDKRSRGKTPLWVAGVLDDASRASYLAAIPTPSAEAVLDAFAAAWTPREDERLPFAGLPEMVYSDNGSWCNSETVRSALDFLGVKFAAHPAYQPWAKGKIERLFRSTGPFWLLDQIQRTQLTETDDGGIRRKILRMTAADLPRFFLRLNLALGNRIHREIGCAPLERWTHLVEEAGGAVRLPPDAEVWETLKLAWLDCEVDGHCTVRLPAGERAALDPTVFSDLVGRTVKVGYRRRERGRPLVDGEEIAVCFDGRRWDVPRRPFEIEGRINWLEQPRTQGERLAAAAGRIDYSQADLTLHLEQGARKFARPTGIPFDIARISGLIGRTMPRQVRRMEAIERLQAAGIFSRPLSETDSRLALQWLGATEVVDELIVDEICRTGRPHEVVGAAGAAARTA